MVEQLDLFAACESKLTPRQWELYGLIKQYSLHGAKITQKEITQLVDGYEWNESETCHDHCPAIWNDIKDLNLSFEIDKIIISKNFEYWIGNEKETKQYLDELWEALEPRLVRYWNYKKKVSHNGQGKLLSNQLNPIDENSKAREFVESFIEL